MKRPTTTLKAVPPLAACLLLLLSAAAGAKDFGTRANFGAVNLNPWTDAPAFVEDFHFTDLQADLHGDLPDLNGDPISAIADFLGIPLPFEAGVSVGGTVNGHFGLDLGYHVNGGRLNISYPAVPMLSIRTLGDTNIVLSNDTTITASMTPGVPLGHTYLTADAAAQGGSGWQVLAGTKIPLLPATPKFTTEFPYASAWADLDYSVNAGAFVDAHATILFKKFQARKDFTIGRSGSFRLAEINPSGVYIAGVGQGKIFGQTFDLGGGASLTLDYPDVNVSGTLQDGGRLAGAGSKPIVTVNANLTQLVPLVGQVLSGGIGPFHYDLLGVEGGPTLNLYQNMQFDPNLRVHLDFSEAVLAEGSDGLLHATNAVDFAPGDPTPIHFLNSYNNAITIRPTYYLGGTFHNQTGLSIGAQITVNALQLETPLGDLGPAFTDTLSQDALIQIPIYDNAFGVQLGQITGQSITLAKALQVIGTDNIHLPLAIQQMSLDDSHDDGNYDTLSILFLDPDTGDAYQVNNIQGQTQFIPGLNPDDPQSVFIADDDLILELSNATGDVLNLGRYFGFNIADFSELFPELNPAIADGNDLLYLSRLFQYADGLVDISSDPLLRQSNFFNQSSASTNVGPLQGYIPLPEPASLAILSAGEILLLARPRRA